MTVPYFRLELDQDTIHRTVEVLKSSWITTGPVVKEFEKEFANYIGGGVTAISVNSCTAGLHLSLEAMGIKAGDEVITTDLTFTATAEVIRYLGATPVVVDCEPNTLCIDFEKVKNAVTKKTKAIIVVHFAGLAVEMKDIVAFAKEREIYILEDAAHALPSYINGNPVGISGADATCFSFYANKTMTTGEGGMVITKNKEIIDRINIMRLHGIDRDAFNRFVENKPTWEYDVIAPGFKYNMTDIAAATGIGQLNNIDVYAQKRRNIAKCYDNSFRSLPIILPPRRKFADHSWHLYVIQINSDYHKNRDDLIDHLVSEGIGFSVHYKPLHLLSYWRDSLKLSAEKFPVADQYFRSCVSLPIFPSMTSGEVDEVIFKVKEFFE